jgi:anti-sigma regulatory factor (Ser/Thr protein kinase)
MVQAAPLAVELPRVPEAPGIARRQLARVFGGALEQSRLHTARLLTSELVTNALLHGAGGITLHASLNDDRLLVEVIDEGLSVNATPRTERDSDGLGGWGLRIVDSEASRWGTSNGPTHVWFELTR